MSLKKGLNLTNYYSINFDIPKRNKKLMKFIIIHYTGMKDEIKAIKRLCNYKSKVSAHYFIKNSGEVINLVPDLYQAWHAGKSNWKRVKSINKYSIGDDIPSKMPILENSHNLLLKKIKIPVKASEDEINANIRARSARLRVAEII